MKIKFLFFIFTGLTLGAFADTQESAFQARVGIGSSFSPQTFMTSAALEYRVDPFFAIGPSLLWGLGKQTDYWVPSLVGRFIVPKELLFGESATLPGADLYLQAGAGYAFRETDGFRFNHFSYQAGLGGDFFINQMISFGLQGNIHVVADAVEESFYSLFATAGLRF